MEIYIWELNSNIGKLSPMGIDRNLRMVVYCVCIRIRKSAAVKISASVRQPFCEGYVFFADVFCVFTVVIWMVKMTMFDIFTVFMCRVFSPADNILDKRKLNCVGNVWTSDIHKSQKTGCLFAVVWAVISNALRPIVKLQDRELL